MTKNEIQMVDLKSQCFDIKDSVDNAIQKVISSTSFINGSDVTDLHTKSYDEILKGNGYGILEARQTIEIVHQIRNEVPVGMKGECHPMAKFETIDHPFKQGKNQ